MKTRILRVFRPSRLTWLFLILVVLAQLMFCTHAHFNVPRQSTWQYGLGHPIEVSYSDGVRQDISIHWIVLIANLTLSYLVSATIAALLRRAIKLENALPLYGGAVLAVASLAFVVSIAFSKVYWGYFFRRPTVLEELKEITEVSSIIPVTTEQTSAGEYRFALNPDFSIAESIAYAEEDPYYNLDERILIYLDQNHLLPDKMASSLGPYADLYDLLPETGLLAKAQDGYTSAGLLRGVIVEARSRTGSEFVFLSATGGQVSNDHYPCYEMAFQSDPQSGQLTFVRGQRFFFDVAGIEGVTWGAVWICVSLLGAVVVLPLATLVGWRYALVAILFVTAVGILVTLDLFAAVSLYPRFVAAYMAFWVLIGGLLLRGIPVRLRLMLLFVFVAQVTAIRFVNWNSRKPFLKDFYRIEEGMTPAQVDQIMNGYTGGNYGGPPLSLTDMRYEFNDQGEIVTGWVTYRHTEEGWGDSDWGTVTFEDGRVVRIHVSPD